MKPKLLFYCKPFGNALAIHNVLKKSEEYNIMYDINDIHKVDYILTSHNDPSNIEDKKLIHVAHGLGCIPKLPYNTYEELRKDHERYHAYGVHGKLEGLWYTGLVKNIMILGMPISIPLLEPINEENRHVFLRSRGLDPENKTIMYGPTWDHSWNKSKQHRGFFYLWWEDGKERKRVDKFCKYITQDLNMNLIIRFHESFRYSQNWLEIYKDIFEKYPNIYAHYLEQDMISTLHMKYSDILIGDLSNMNTIFYMMNKPVVHIGKDPFRKRRNKGYCSVGINDRAGYVVDNFNELLDCINDSVIYPLELEDIRNKIVNKYIDFTGDECKQQILREFKRICQK